MLAKHLIAESSSNVPITLLIAVLSLGIADHLEKMKWYPCHLDFTTCRAECGPETQVHVQSTITTHG